MGDAHPLDGTTDGNERNRAAFAAPEVVADYASMDDLTPAEHLVLSDVAPASRILDLGVGTGRTTRHLAPGAARYVGIDVAAPMIERARRLHPDADLRVGDAADLGDFEAASFDLVVFSYNGIDYLVPDARRAACLAEVARVLAPGGRFVFSVHNPATILRPPARPVTARGLAVAAYQTVRRLPRLARRSTWSDSAYVLDRARGGLVTHQAVPSHVVAETERHGFRHRRTVPGDHPRPPRRFRTGWWYYEFERAGAAAATSS